MSTIVRKLLKVLSENYLCDVGDKSTVYILHIAFCCSNVFNEGLKSNRFNIKDYMQSTSRIIVSAFSSVG
jgi:hypothetical protein